MKAQQYLHNTCFLTNHVISEHERDHENTRMALSEMQKAYNESQEALKAERELTAQLKSKSVDDESKIRGLEDRVAQLESEKENTSSRRREITRLQEVVQELERERTSHENFSKEHNERKEALEQQLAATERSLHKLQDHALNNPYALCLIDGDGYLFNRFYLCRGFEGGRLAASDLYEAIHKYFYDHDFRRESLWHLRVCVYFDFEGLSRKMQSVGYLANPQLLREFAQGFTLNQPLFEMVDVGKPKEATDHKIRSMFDFSVPDVGHRCHHVLLGCSNDQGYMRTIECHLKNSR